MSKFAMLHECNFYGFTNVHPESHTYRVADSLTEFLTELLTALRTEVLLTEIHSWLPAVPHA